MLVGAMTYEDRRTRHAELAFSLAGRDRRLLDALTQRPHLLNPYPNIVARLSRRSRRFRMKLLGTREPRRSAPRVRISRAALDLPALAGTPGR
jgi:hypothetical protein